MCLLVFAWDRHPRYRFVLAGNRDEFHARPSRAAQWWEEDGDFLAGRDELAGGTWLGVRRDGRFGVVTNYREMDRRRDDARSRGELIAGVMHGGETYLDALAGRGDDYNGYNLIAGDLPGGPLHYRSNRGPGGLVDPGVHGLSNHRLDTRWPKVERSLGRLEKLLAADRIRTDDLLELLADREPAAGDALPDTGIGESFERLLSPVFIVSPEYGTRCSTVILLDRDGSLQFVERRFAADGSTTGESRFEFSTAPS